MKRLLYIFSAIVLLHGCSPTSNKRISSVQNTDNSIKSNFDSIQLSTSIKNAILNFIDYEDTTKSINWDYVDSLLAVTPGGCCDADLTYTPDSLFKIFTIKGETCGMYCNPFWEWEVYSNKDKKIIGYQNSNLFKEITEIHKLPDGKYLVLQKEYGRPASVLTVSCRIATIISIRNDSLMCYPVLANTYDDNLMKDFDNNEIGLEFCQEHFVSLEEPDINSAEIILIVAKRKLTH